MFLGHVRTVSTVCMADDELHATKLISSSTTASSLNSRKEKAIPYHQSAQANFGPKQLPKRSIATDQRTAPQRWVPDTTVNPCRRLNQYDRCRYRHSAGTGSLHAVGGVGIRRRKARSSLCRTYAYMQCTCKPHPPT